MDKNTGTDNVVQRLSGANTIAEQAAEIAALRLLYESADTRADVQKDMLKAKDAEIAALREAIELKDEAFRALREATDIYRALLKEKMGEEK